MKNNLVKNFWENCNTTFAHITTDDWLKNKENLISVYSKNIKRFRIDPNNKKVVDYGIGGGYLGQYLLSNYSISEYIGLDIAERSLDAAKKNLSKYKNVSLHLTPVNFSKFGADIFFSFAVIQHFPNKKYLDDFLTNLDNSGISELLLQIRHNKSTIFSKKYETLSDARLGCRTNSKYLLKNLKKYQLCEESQINTESQYQYLHFKKIN